MNPFRCCRCKLFINLVFPSLLLLYDHDHIHLEEILFGRWFSHHTNPSFWSHYLIFVYVISYWSLDPLQPSSLNQKTMLNICSQKKELRVIFVSSSTNDYSESLHSCSSHFNTGTNCLTETKRTVCVPFFLQIGETNCLFASNSISGSGQVIPFQRF